MNPAPTDVDMPYRSPQRGLVKIHLRSSTSQNAWIVGACGVVTMNGATVTEEPNDVTCERCRGYVARLVAERVKAWWLHEVSLKNERYFLCGRVANALATSPELVEPTCPDCRRALSLMAKRDEAEKARRGARIERREARGRKPNPAAEIGWKPATSKPIDPRQAAADRRWSESDAVSQPNHTSKAKPGKPGRGKRRAARGAKRGATKGGVK